MKLATELCGIELEHPVMNAAGTCKTLGEFTTLLDTDVAGGTVGSITLLERRLQEGMTRWRGPHYSLNALQLPNPGGAYYDRTLPQMKQVAERAGKPLKVSVAGFSAEEFCRLAGLAYKHGADLIELDFGSMTVWQESDHERIITFDPALVEEIWRQLMGGRWVHRNANVGVKLSPIPDPAYISELAELLRELDVKFITASNTFAYGSGPREVVAEGLEFAGVGGPGLKPIALGQVRQFRECLPGIDIVGVGGIEAANDVLDYLDAGATTVEVATSVGNIDSIVRQLKSIT